MEQQRYNIELIKKLILSVKKYKKILLTIIALMFLTALTEAFIPILNRYAIDEFVVARNFEMFNVFIMIYIVTIASLSFFVYAFIAAAGKFETTYVYDLRKEAFNKLQHLSLSYYDKNAEGWIIARITSDIGSIGEKITWGIVDLIWGSSMMTIVLIIMLSINARLTIIVLCMMPVLVFISTFFQNKLLVAHRLIRKLNSKITGKVAEGISGAIATKVLVSEDTNLDDFKDTTGNMRERSIQAAVLSAVYLSIVVVLSSAGMALAIYFGGNGVIANTVTYGTLVMFLTYTKQFFQPIQEIARIVAEFKAAQASIERVYNLIDEKLEIDDSDAVKAVYGDLLEKKYENWESINGVIEFKNVTFHYTENEPLLNNFNLRVEAGSKIAIVGETGAGKSTLINLISRFYEPIHGEILIDEVDYRKRSLSWLHSNIGYVLQDPHLFSGTIKENIKYGNLDATDEAVINAAKLVNAHEFIIKKENGYDSNVGEGGNLLSTGEKQLISFARAIVANPKIFILDEATSSIDTETEFIIQRAIDNITKERTSFIIAHRLSTIVDADRILVMKNGKIVESGNHHELLSQKGYYSTLYKAS
ncbi:MAG TPA: ABC transporter ATP-binding protein [Clostridia bacterium]|nr:ABC transporter ATP-binding protein [Clostridia bacterium]